MPTWKPNPEEHLATFLPGVGTLGIRSLEVQGTRTMLTSALESGLGGFFGSGFRG